MVTLSFDLPFTYELYLLEYPAASETVMDTVGFTLDGILHVIFFSFEPRLVPPLYVVIVRVTDTEVPVVFCLASANGGVHFILVLLDFEHMVSVALPHLYVMVCVNVSDCRVTVSVCSVPRVPLLALRLLFRGIVVSVFDADAVTSVALCRLQLYQAEHDRFFVPSLLWLTFTVFVNSV